MSAAVREMVLSRCLALVLLLVFLSVGTSRGDTPLPPSADAAKQGEPAPNPDQTTPKPAEAVPKPDEAGTPPASPAAPENPPPAPPPAAVAPTSPPPPKNIETVDGATVETVLGKQVVDPSGKDMGLVVDILFDRDGAPRAAIIDFGGFLGVGTRKIAVDWQLLKFTPEDPKAAVQLSLDRPEVQAAPEYKPSASPVAIIGPPPPAPPAPAEPEQAPAVTPAPTDSGQAPAVAPAPTESGQSHPDAPAPAGSGQ